jgi:hypothetical protein
MTRQTEIAREIERTGYVVLPGRLNGHALGAARAGLGSLLDAAGWGSAGFDGTRTKRVWAPLSVTRCSPAASTTAPAPTPPPDLCSASTSRPLTSASSTAGTPATGSWATSRAAINQLPNY